MKNVSFKSRFLIFVVVYFIINISYSYFYSQGTYIDDGLRRSESAISVQVLRVFFDKVSLYSVVRRGGELGEEIRIEGSCQLIVINECNAFSIHLIYSVFILMIVSIYPRWFALVCGNIFI